MTPNEVLGAVFLLAGAALSLLAGVGIWRLPVLDMIWERDGLPGFRRLEGGGLAGGRRAPARPQTF